MTLHNVVLSLHTTFFVSFPSSFGIFPLFQDCLVLLRVHPSGQWFSNISMHQIIWREGWAEVQLKNCASNKFPSEVVAAGPGPESENH